MTYKLSNELLEGEEREAIRLLAGRPIAEVKLEDALIFWPHIEGHLYVSLKISVTRNSDYVKIEMRE